VYSHFFRPILFKLDPEQAHALTLNLIRLAGKLSPLSVFLRHWFSAPQTPVQAFGLQFTNLIGLAAGYDKDGLGWRGLACLGFGHIEIGTVTPKPQPGNPRLRIFRLKEDLALINRMGFPGKGAEAVKRNLLGKRPKGLVLGVNLGKNKDTPLEGAVQDYLILLKTFFPFADYLSINVSSPNTIGLRRLQGREMLNTLLVALAQERNTLVDQYKKQVPLLVKLAPDLEHAELDDALEVILEVKMDGVIATNTTINRQKLKSTYQKESGGLSGAPLCQRSTQMIAEIHKRTEGKLPIIGVGGVMDAQSAREKFDAGATLIQLYTGLVYAGPGLVKTLLKAF
jgi:dihydroorotate dehydrogenase